MNPVRALRNTAGLTQAQLAEAGGTSQPTVAAYESGAKSPAWRTVERLVQRAGLCLEVRFHPALTREERRSIALHRVIAERLEADPALVISRARATLARMHALHPGARPLLDEWGVLLRRPLSALVPVFTDLSPWARELRHVTPFAGVLTARERAIVYGEFARAERTAQDAAA